MTNTTQENEMKTLSDIEYAISVRLKRSANHHCYTEGLTIQKASNIGWVCGHCNSVVEPLTDKNVQSAFGAKTAKSLCCI